MSTSGIDWGELRTLPVEKNWYKLGLSLGLSAQQLDTIEQKQPNPFKRKVEMLKSWFEKDKTASWETVVDALYMINETGLATDVQSWHRIQGQAVWDSSSSGYGSSPQTLSPMIEQPQQICPDETDGVLEEVKSLYNNHYIIIMQ